MGIQPSRFWSAECDRCGSVSSHYISRKETERAVVLAGWHVFIKYGLQMILCPNCRKSSERSKD